MSKTTIIAEMSANHRQKLDTALDIVREVARAGADVIKTQTYKASTLTIPGPSADYIVDGGTPWDGKRLEDLYREAEMPWEFNEPIMQLAKELGLGFLSTVYDPTSVEYLEKLGVDAYKVASFEITDLSLLKLIGQTHKKLFLSTGLASHAEIIEACGAYIGSGGLSVVLLACCSSYPAPLCDMNVRRIETLRNWHPSCLGLETYEFGLSDHSFGSVAACAAVALGATFLEKHAGMRPGTADACFSSNEIEFVKYVCDVRLTEKALGSGHLVDSRSESGEIRYRKSMYFTRDIAKGEIIKRSDLKSYRPALGYRECDALRWFVGCYASHDIKAGDPAVWENKR